MLLRIMQKKAIRNLLRANIDVHSRRLVAKFPKDGVKCVEHFKSRCVLGKYQRATSMGAHYQCSPETDHNFLRDSPLTQFRAEVCQASKWRCAKPVILARHTTLARCTRQDSNLLQVEGCQANNNQQGPPPTSEIRRSEERRISLV